MKAYEVITAKIIEKLESGVIPWSKPWADTFNPPMNAISGNRYSGINVFMLAGEYGNPNWMTFKQAQDAGGKVRKGEKGTPIVFWSLLKKDHNGKYVQANQNDDKNDIIPVLKYFHVFNVEQIDELPEALTTYTKPAKLNADERIQRAESLITNFACGPKVTFGGNRAAYAPLFDTVMMPEYSQFAGAAEYYSTFFHELVHSTGHRSRLNREGVAELDRSDVDKYGKEELIAEMGAAFLCNTAGIKHTIENSAAYIGSWLKVIKQPKNVKLVINAASAAQKAAEHIMAHEAKAKAA